ncbi:hypothetical protein SETIT_8G207500v2 [Setaria italica]|uniref:Uncharacterized protein n=1 Tax=Setaria italica TaxID=4555 RepID=A0A368S9X8_SETIT|nr:hypothetical protein SETIT_8G207500v2 [Setaria italica]
MASVSPPVPGRRRPPDPVQGRHATRRSRLSAALGLAVDPEPTDPCSDSSTVRHHHLRLHAQAAADPAPPSRTAGSGKGDMEDTRHGHARTLPPPADRFAVGVAVSGTWCPVR